MWKNFSNLLYLELQIILVIENMHWTETGDPDINRYSCGSWESVGWRLIQLL